MTTTQTVTHLERRRIEAAVLVPMIQAFQPLPAPGGRLEFNVTRCRYAELFQELGLPELGALIHCSRDFAMAEGFSGELELKRTQTLMQGASRCDFRFRTKSGSEPE